MIATTVTRDEIRRLRERQREMLWQGTVREMAGKPSRHPMAYLEKTVPGDVPHTAYWPDVNYQDQARSGWVAREHYVRLLNLLICEGREKLEADAEYREGVLACLRYWLVHDFVNPNWWHNEIGTPMNLADLALLLSDYMTEAEKAKAFEIIARGSLKGKPDIAKWTGANLLWGMQTTVRHGLLIEDGELLAAAAERTGQELKYAQEGVQPDGAFCQHGPRWYSGGYGGNFTFDLAQLIYLFEGSSLAFPREKLELYLLHVLDGQRRMTFRGYFDYNAIGREFSRPDSIRKGELFSGLALLSRLDTLPRIDEIRAFFAECMEKKTGVCGTRYYPSVSYLNHREKDVFVGVKCHNAGQYDEELCNSEGELVFNMSYGTRTCLMARGDEYENIDPLWDFAHIPGTVARLETDAELYAHRNWWCLPLPNDETRGYADEHCGILQEHAEHDGISARVAFFAFEGNLAALGCAINDTTGGKPLTVTLEQAFAVDPEVGEKEASNGGFTYRNLDDSGKLIAEYGVRQGDWKRNYLELPSRPVEGNLFTAYVPLDGKNSHYAYCVSPRGSAPTIRILANREDVQAVEVVLAGKSAVLAAFHADCVLQTAGEKIAGTKGQCGVWYLPEKAE